uniref:Uncharacterized protein n=1 Tax=Romanomermis culicivorax TaxID=13658 RepID=A0A915JNR2_ROMCU
MDDIYHLLFTGYHLLFQQKMKHIDASIVLEMSSKESTGALNKHLKITKLSVNDPILRAIDKSVVEKIALDDQFFSMVRNLGFARGTSIIHQKETDYLLSQIVWFQITENIRCSGLTIDLYITRKSNKDTIRKCGQSKKKLQYACPLEHKRNTKDLDCSRLIGRT